MSQHPHVLVFDSGVGGLSVAREILAAHPQCRITYASDNAAFPYGTKDADWLIARVDKVIGQLINHSSPDVLVVACNTASTLALSQLRDRYDRPFVGVVPAVKPAAHMSKTKHIGVLATPATVARPYTRQLIEDFALGCHVSLHGSGLLVVEAERKILGLRANSDIISHELHNLIDQPFPAQMDTIVLACTHFPLLREELEEAALPRKLVWVDSGEAIARRVGYWLGQLKASDDKYEGRHSILLTADADVWDRLEQTLPIYLGGRNLEKPTIIDV